MIPSCTIYPITRIRCKPQVQRCTHVLRAYCPYMASASFLLEVKHIFLFNSLRPAFLVLKLEYPATRLIEFLLVPGCTSHQFISNHGIVYARQGSPYHPWQMISTTGGILLLRNYRQYNYILLLQMPPISINMMWSFIISIQRWCHNA